MTAGGDCVHESYEIRRSTIPIDLYRPRNRRHRLFVGVTILTSSICREDHIYHICDTRYWNSSDCVEETAASVTSYQHFSIWHHSHLNLGAGPSAMRMIPPCRATQVLNATYKTIGLGSSCGDKRDAIEGRCSIIYCSFPQCIRAVAFASLSRHFKMSSGFMLFRSHSCR